MLSDFPSSNCIQLQQCFLSCFTAFPILFLDSPSHIFPHFSHFSHFSQDATPGTHRACVQYPPPLPHLHLILHNLLPSFILLTMPTSVLCHDSFSNKAPS